MANANVKGALAALLFVIGAVGGAVGGGAAGILIGRRSATPAPLPAAPPRLEKPRPTAVPPDAGSPSIPATKDGGLAPSDGGAAASRDGGTPKPTTELCVEVRDSGGRLVSGALVAVRPLAALGSRPSATLGEHKEIGELGVYSSALPYPDDVISGQYTPLGRSTALPVSSTSAGPRTDAQGRACLPLAAPGSFAVTAMKEDRSASVEIMLPASPQPASAKPLPLSIILRLGEPIEALCRLTTPTPLLSEEPTEAVSESLGPDITGRVVDGRGFALPAVRIEAQVGGRARAVATSDGRGSFRLLGLPRGPLSLRAQLAGYAPQSLSRRADEPRSEVQIVLRPGGGIAGVLRDARRGNLPQGAQLTFVSSADGTSMNVPLAADGSFTLSGLPSGPATLRARAPGHAPQVRSIQIATSDAPGQIAQRDLRIDLEASGSIAGQLRGPTGAAGNVTVTVQSDDGSQVGKTLTDERGEFHLNELPAGHLRINAASSQGRGETSVDLRSGNEERVYLELRP